MFVLLNQLVKQLGRDRLLLLSKSKKQGQDRLLWRHPKQKTRTQSFALAPSKAKNKSAMWYTLQPWPAALHTRLCCLCSLCSIL